MTRQPLGPDQWEFVFEKYEVLFLHHVLSEMATQYGGTIAELPPEIRDYWKGLPSPQQRKRSVPPLRNEYTENSFEAEEVDDGEATLREVREELRSERSQLVQNWLKNMETAESTDPWRATLDNAQINDFIAILNDRRLTLALEYGLYDLADHTPITHLPTDLLRAVALEIELIGSLIQIAIE